MNDREPRHLQKGVSGKTQELSYSEFATVEKIDHKLGNKGSGKTESMIDRTRASG